MHNIMTNQTNQTGCGCNEPLNTQYVNSPFISQPSSHSSSFNAPGQHFTPYTIISNGNGLACDISNGNSNNNNNRLQNQSNYYQQQQYQEDIGSPYESLESSTKRMSINSFSNGQNSIPVATTYIEMYLNEDGTIVPVEETHAKFSALGEPNDKHKDDVSHSVRRMGNTIGYSCYNRKLKDELYREQNNKHSYRYRKEKYNDDYEDDREEEEEEEEEKEKPVRHYVSKRNKALEKIKAIKKHQKNIGIKPIDEIEDICDSSLDISHSTTSTRKNSSCSSSSVEGISSPYRRDSSHSYGRDESSQTSYDHEKELKKYLNNKFTNVREGILNNDSNSVSYLDTDDEDVSIKNIDMSELGKKAKRLSDLTKQHKKVSMLEVARHARNA